MNRGIRMTNIIELISKGGLIGVANIIPGVSGGTMAVVLGLYERLIEAIGNIATDRERRREYVIFLLQIGAGAALAIVLLSWLMDFLLTYYPGYTYLFFIGLIAGSVPSVYRTHDDMRLTASSVFAFIAGMGLILSVSFLFPAVEKSTNGVADFQMSFIALGLLFISGILSGGSMIVPGISGSFMLVLLGQYKIAIKAIKELNVLILAILGSGALLGVWGFARLIDASLKRFPRQTMYFILGLVLASLYPIFPGIPEGLLERIAAAGLMVIAAVISLYLGERG